MTDPIRKISNPECWSRRDFLAISGAGGGFGLAALAWLASHDSPAKAADNPDILPPLAPRNPHVQAVATNCIFVYLYGGASHIDLFDPKPKLNELHGQPLPDSLAANLRFAFVKRETARFLASPRTFQRYGQSGLEFSDLLPNLAGCADDLAVVRSMHTEAFNHAPGELMTNTGTVEAGHPSVGAWLTYGLGSESQELPGYVVMIQGDRVKAYTWSNGFLPAVHQGVRLSSQGDPVRALRNPPGVDAQLQRSQLDALRELNGRRALHLRDPQIAARIANYELAWRMQTTAPGLIELSREPQHVRDLYGVDRADEGERNFSTQCLLARRLVERGVRFVHLIHANWDQHKDLDQDLTKNCKAVDQPLAALLLDLKRRGMLASTLVVVCTEFGRTPVSDNGQKPEMPNGRDHHPSAFSVLLAGGGVRGGRVIGKTDELGWDVVEDPVHVHDLHATMLHLFGLDHLRLTYRFRGRDFRLTDVSGRVIAGLV